MERGIVGSRALTGVTLALLGLLQMAPSWALEVGGELRWLRRVELGLPLSGVVGEVKVVAGQAVSKGDLLLSLDGRLQRAALMRSESELEKMKLEMAEAERELERSEELYERTLLSVHDLEVARLTHAGVKSAYQSALAGVTEARVGYEYTRLKAPFDALVLERLVETGASVSGDLQGHPLVVLADRKQMLARIELSDAQMAGLKVGQAVVVRVEGASLPGQIHALGYEPLANRQQQLYAVDVIFAVAADQPYRVGQRVTIELE